MEKTCKLRDISNVNRVYKIKRGQIRQSYLDCYSEMHSESIDKNSIKVEFLKTDHRTTNKFGIKTFIDLSTIKSGNHTITVVKI